MLTKSPIIKHIEAVPVGSVFYYPNLGDGTLCVAAKYDGQSGDRTTVVVPLTDTSNSDYALRIFDEDNLSGYAALPDGLIAEVDLQAATSIEEAAAYVASDGTYIRVWSDHPGFRHFLRLDDGIIRSSVPAASIGFTGWKIVLEDDPTVEFWSSDRPDNRAK